ncbi:hypothetical protein GGS26DRAFT_591305 [Hypomontagnella submonticulosa]|nr:hypothetical protein GGS26DRAFT_591305 [Hypomontagnella submonticulosa]
MATSSNKAVRNGETPRKPSHYFSRHPPTSHPVDQQSLRDYRLFGYLNGLDNMLPVHPYAYSSSEVGAPFVGGTGVSNDQCLLGMGSQFRLTP